MELLKENDRIYYGGDMANQEGFGTIKKVIHDKWGTDYKIILDDGREFHVSPSSFSKEYLGHGGTRFVTEKAYFDYRAKKLEEFQGWSKKLLVNI